MNRAYYKTCIAYVSVFLIYPNESPRTFELEVRTLESHFARLASNSTFTFENPRGTWKESMGLGFVDLFVKENCLHRVEKHTSCSNKQISLIETRNNC